jgi:hypothetical protein
MDNMKLLLNSIYQFLESIGQACTAAHFARMGRYDLARDVMITK